MKEEYITFIDFYSLSDEEKYKELIKLRNKVERLNKEKSILEKSLKLIWEKDIEIDYEELDNANKVLEEALKEGK